MRQNQHLDQKYLLDRLVSDKLTVSEKTELENYIHNSFHDNELDLLMQNHWKELNSREIVANETQLLILKNKILSRIHPTTISHKKESVVYSFNWKNSLMRVAAILFIPLLLGTAFMMYRMDQRSDMASISSIQEKVVANPGSRVYFVLPDRTEVWLNSGSMLEFPISLDKLEIRKVKLKGQGYFNVTHDEKHPFIVETDGLNIKALGTSFDVSGYSEDNQISSTLESGSIALMNQNGLEVARLHPGQKALLDRTTRLLTIRNVETQLSTSWKDGKLVFRKTPLLEVTKQMERWFNCKIHVEPRLAKMGLIYTATIQDETLGEVIKMIEISTSVKTKIEKREVFIEKKN
ncbi:MAG: FecR domain-containing protein [Prolixibacteraceae bacterium]